jgi:cell fate regulator YaaT (PSP1 superfamily)
LNSHYTFDKSLAIFQFAAENRVDFRELVRDLSGALHCRVELRQIGVRDEASIQGGLGPCGRPFCCATFLTKFQTVNVKMAKMQRLSLNPTSVSGGCGRLKCCLRYEADGYQEMFRSIPRNGSLCETPRGRGRVLDGNALTQVVRVRLEDENGLIVDFQADEVSRLSGGRDRRPTKDMADESDE